MTHSTQIGVKPRRRPRSTSSTRRQPRATTTKRPKSLLDGPMRAVVYIFEREGTRGGALWWLVLECGHAVSRKRHVAKSESATAHLLLRPLRDKLAPRRCQCLYCGAGSSHADPAILIRAFGGEVP